MLRFLCDKSHRYGRAFLCLIVACILIVCTACEKPESERLSYAGMNNENTISSTDSEICDIIVSEYTGFSVLKDIASRNSVNGRLAGFRTMPACVVISSVHVTVGTCTFFLLYLLRDLVTSHHFIITYIHNLDGMKP